MISGGWIDYFFQRYVVTASLAAQLRQVMVVVMRLWQIEARLIAQVVMFGVDRETLGAFQQRLGQQMRLVAMGWLVNAIAPAQGPGQPHQVIRHRQMFVTHLRNLRARLLQLLFQSGPLAFFGPDAALRRLLSLAESRRLHRQLVAHVMELL